MNSELRKALGSLRKLEAREVGRPHCRIMRSNVGVPNTLDVRVQPQYDFFQVAKNTACVAETLFTTPQGQQYTPAGGTALVKTAFHTSLQGQGGVLSNPLKLLVKNISLMNDPTMVSDDVNGLVLNYLCTFNVQNKIFWQGHAQKLPSGGGTWTSGAFVVGTTAPTGSSALHQASTNGWPSAGNYSPLWVDGAPGAADSNGNPLPQISGVLIESGQPFNFTVDPTQTKATVFTTTNFSAAANGILSAGITAWVYLEGITMVAVV